MGFKDKYSTIGGDPLAPTTGGALDIGQSTYDPTALTDTQEPTSGFELAIKGIGAGAVASVDETISTVVEIAEWTHNVFAQETDHVDWDWKKTRGEQWFDEDFGAVGNTLKSITKFGVGMVALGKLKVLSSLGRVGASVARGAVTDFVMSSEDEGLLSDFLADLSRDEYGEVSNSVLAFMAGDDDEDTLTFKLKAVLEGAFLGVAFDTALGAFKGISKLGRDHIKNASGGDKYIADSIMERIGGKATKRALSFEETLTGSSTTFKEKMKPTVTPRIKGASEGIDALDDITTEELTKRFIKVETEVPLATYIDAMQVKNPNASLEDIVQGLVDGGLWTESAERGAQLLDDVTEMIVKTDVGREGHALLNKEVEYLERTLFKDLDTAGLPKALQKQTATGRAMAVRTRYFKMTEVRMQDNIDALLLKDSLTDSEMIDLQAKLMEYANVEPYFRAESAAVGRMLKARDLAYKSLYDVNGEPVETMTEALAKKLAEAGGNTKELGDLIGAIKKHGGIKKYISDGGFEKSQFSKWVDAYTAFRHQNMLSGWKTGIMNTMSTSAKITTDQNIAPLFAGILEGDRNQIRQSFYSLQSFWSNMGDTIRGVVKNVGDLEGDSMFQKLGNLFDTNKRNAFIEQNKTVSRLSREGAEQVGNTSAHLGFEGTRVGKVWDTAVAFNSMASTFTTSLPDLVQGNASFFSAVDGLVARDFIRSHMSAEAKRNLRSNIQELAEYYMANNKRLPANVPHEWGMKLAGVFEEATQGAREALFQQNTGAVHGLVSWVKNIENPVGRLVANTMMPFVSTPVNIANTILEMSPVLGSMSRKVQKELATGGAVRAQREAKQLIGASLYASGAMLAMSGKLTGSHPKNDREVLVAGGIPENSVKIGDTWYELNRLDPFGSFLTLMGNVTQSVAVTEVATGQEAMMMLVNGVADSTFSKTYMRGIGDLWQAVTEPERHLEPFLQNWGASMVPVGSLQRSINQVIDPTIKESHDFLDKLNQYTIGQGSKAPAKLDAFGYELGEESLMSRVFGIRTHQENPNVAPEVLSELIATRTMPTDRDGSFNGVKLTKEESYQAKLHMADRGAYTKLESLVNSAGYRSMNLGSKQKALRKLVGTIRKQGRTKMLQSDVEAKARHRAVRREMRDIALSRRTVGESSTNLEYIQSRLLALPSKEI
jgi:hypothetical protein